MSDERKFPMPMGNSVLAQVFDPQSEKWGTGFFGQSVQTGDDKPLPARGVIVAVGPGTMILPQMERVPMEVEVGDEVLFFDQFAQPIEIDGQRLVLLAQENIMVVVNRLGLPTEIQQFREVEDER